MVVLARAWQMLGSDIKNDYKMRVKEIVQERFSGKVADWSIPMSYAPPPGKNAGAKVKTLEVDSKMQAATKAKIEVAATPKPPPAPEAPKEELAPEKAPEPAAPPPENEMKRLSGAHTPFHQKAIETKAEMANAEKHADTAPPPPKVKVETDMQLSEDFAELDELASAVEKSIPHPIHDPKPEKW